MNIIFLVRGAIGRFLKRFNLPFGAIIKFIGYFLLFHYVAGMEGFAAGARINSLPVQLILALLSMILPSRCGILLAIVLMLANIWKVTMLGTAVAGILFLFVYIMTSRLFPDQVYMLALVPLCLHYKLYLLLPVAAGMYVGVIALIPMIMGIIVHILLGLVPEFMTLQMPEKIDAIPKVVTNVFKYVFSQILNNDTLIFLMILFTVIVVLIFLLRKIEINYGAYIALLAGVVLGVICMIMGKVTFDIADSTQSIIGHAAITLVILALIEFMRTALDYEAMQRLSFEDDEYEYHVTLIPKIDLTKDTREAKRRERAERIAREEEEERLEEERIAAEKEARRKAKAERRALKKQAAETPELPAPQESAKPAERQTQRVPETRKPSEPGPAVEQPTQRVPDASETIKEQPKKEPAKPEKKTQSKTDTAFNSFFEEE